MSDRGAVGDPGRWVIVPIDEPGGDDRSLVTAVDVAQRIDAGVRLFSVVDDEADVDERWAGLAAMASGIAEAPTAVDVVADDDVAGTVADATGERDIICMTTAASLLPHQGHFGSIAEAIVRRVDRPVLLLGPQADPSISTGLSRIVVPVDGSATSEAALRPASILAEILKLPLWVVTVVSLGEQRAATAQLGSEAAAAESGYVRLLARQAAESHDIDAEFEVLHISEPADAILDFAQPDGLVVMSTHGKSGLARLFAGSVTTSVVARSAHPVVVLRPEPGLLEHE